MRFRLALGLVSIAVLFAMTDRAHARSDAEARAAAASQPSPTASDARTGRTAAAVTTVDTAAEQRFLNRINRERARRGLPALVRDAALGDLARFHSADMAITGFVGLTSPGEGSLIDRAARAARTSMGDVTAQVASGSDLSQVGAPLLDPSARRVGVGIVAMSGRLFLTQLAIAGDRDQRYTAADAARLPDLASHWLGLVAVAIERLVRIAPVHVAFGWR